MKRSTTLDMLKAVSTVLVVLVHSYNIFDYAHYIQNNAFVSIFRELAKAGVPIFFMVSGYLLAIKDFNWQNNIRKKVKTLLIPYHLWIAMYILIEAIGYAFIPEKFSDVFRWSVSEWLINLFGIPFLVPPIYAPFWFVRDLFLLNMVAGWIKKAAEKLPGILSLIAILIVWYLPLPGYFRQAVCFFPLGILAAVKWPNIIDDSMKTKWTIILGGGVH